MDRYEAVRIILAVSLVLVLLPRVARLPHPWGRRVRIGGAAVLAAGLLWAVAKSIIWFWPR